MHPHLLRLRKCGAQAWIALHLQTAMQLWTQTARQQQMGADCSGADSG